MKTIDKTMKRMLFILAVLCGSAWLTACSESKANSETEFWVRGNCDMCKETIETALGEVDGVANAEYDLDQHMAKVSFDSAATNKDALVSAVLQAGYDTKTGKADESAYTSLPKCCKKPEDR